MDEILYELRAHAAGLNAGRWDYLFSIIKNFRDAGPAFVLPDRAAVTMTAPFMRAYTELLVATCHRRGAFAIGGMAAFIPSRRDAEVNERALAKVREDKEREAGDGFDGSWVAHPDLVPVCREVFDARPRRPAATSSTATAPTSTSPPAQLLDVAADARRRSPRPGCATTSRSALRTSRPGWAATARPRIHNLMEDAATAEISRSQIWQWVANDVVLDTGDTVTADLVRRIMDEELDRLGERPGVRRGAATRQARDLFERVALADDFADFLTLPAYELIDDRGPGRVCAIRAGWISCSAHTG